MIGISPGTRCTGTAIIKDGTLVDWGVKMFKEEWSDKKLFRILQVLEKLIISYNISSIAIKRNHEARTSDALERIIQGVIAMAKRLNIPCKGYTLQELKQNCNGAKTKESLMSYVLQNYPEVGIGIKVTDKNINYHMKTMEAVALAHVLN